MTGDIVGMVKADRMGMLNVDTVEKWTIEEIFEIIEIQAMYSLFTVKLRIQILLR